MKQLDMKTAKALFVALGQLQWELAQLSKTMELLIPEISTLDGSLRSTAVHSQSVGAVIGVQAALEIVRARIDVLRQTRAVFLDGLDVPLWD